MLISPGALDMAGLVITPRKEDFDRLTPSLLVKTVGEVALGQEAFAKVLRRLQEPRVAVGITSGPEVAFVLEGSFMVDGTLQTGPQTVRAKDGRLFWQENSYDTLTFAPHSPQSSFTLPEVTIASDSTGSARRRRPSRGCCGWRPTAIGCGSSTNCPWSAISPVSSPARCGPPRRHRSCGPMPSSPAVGS